MQGGLLTALCDSFSNRAGALACDRLGAYAPARLMALAWLQAQQDPRAYFALGQTRAGLKQWRLAQAAYEKAATLETNQGQRARSLLGQGVHLPSLWLCPEMLLHVAKHSAFSNVLHNKRIE